MIEETSRLVAQRSCFPLIPTKFGRATKGKQNIWSTRRSQGETKVLVYLSKLLNLFVKIVKLICTNCTQKLVTRKKSGRRHNKERDCFLGTISFVSHTLSQIQRIMYLSKLHNIFVQEDKTETKREQYKETKICMLSSWDKRANVCWKVFASHL